MDFLLVLIELFYLGVTSEAQRAKIDRKSAISIQRGQFDPKFQRNNITVCDVHFTVRQPSDDVCR